MSMQEQEYIDYLTSCWSKAGINKGDILLIHSSITRLIRPARRQGVRLSPDHILTSFLQAVGPEGTLLFPTFKIDVSETVHFDSRNTPSSMGVLTEAARNHPDAIRTEHPILSMAVIGKEAINFKKCQDYTGIGKDSPFNLLHKLDGKIAVLGLAENDSMSFYHYVENVNNVDHRWIIDFETVYIDEKGEESLRKHGFYARKRDEGVTTNVEAMGRLLWDKGYYSGNKHDKEEGLRVVAAVDVFRETEKIIKSGKSKGYLYDLVES